MSNESVFRYRYSAAQNSEVRSIREKYLPRQESKLDELRRLDRRVQSAGLAEALSIGAAGCPLFGLGLCIAMHVLGGSTLLGAADSFFTDLFLDVVMMPDGRIILLDEDELEQALEEHIIDRVTYDIVRGDAAALCRALDGNAAGLEKLCREILDELLRKL